LIGGPGLEDERLVGALLVLVVVAGQVLLVLVQAASSLAIARKHRHDRDDEEKHGAANGQRDLPRAQLLVERFASEKHRPVSNRREEGAPLGLTFASRVAASVIPCAVRRS
jgi:hypothetical protein